MTSNKSQPDDENLLDQRTARVRSGQKQQEEEDKVNYRLPEPARQAACQESGRLQAR